MDLPVHKTVNVLVTTVLFLAITTGLHILKIRPTQTFLVLDGYCHEKSHTDMPERFVPHPNVRIGKKNVSRV